MAGDPSDGVDVGSRVPTCDARAMGFDPNRPHKARPSDVWFVAAGLVVALLLVLWAFLG